MMKGMKGVDEAMILKNNYIDLSSVFQILLPVTLYNVRHDRERLGSSWFVVYEAFALYVGKKS